jgi:hypothetical protein
MGQKLRVLELLSSDEVGKLEAFCRERARTVDECFDWVLALGFTLSRSAVGTWKQKLDEQLLGERFSRSGELAASIKSAVSGGDAVAIGDASVLQLAQVVFEQSLKLDAGGAIDPLDVMRMTRSLKNLLDGKRMVETLKSEMAAKVIAEAEKTAKGGGDGNAVVNKVREILGIGDAAKAA